VKKTNYIKFLAFYFPTIVFTTSFPTNIKKFPVIAWSFFGFTLQEEATYKEYQCYFICSCECFHNTFLSCM